MREGGSALLGWSTGEKGLWEGNKMRSSELTEREKGVVGIFEVGCGFLEVEWVLY